MASRHWCVALIFMATVAGSDAVQAECLQEEQLLFHCEVDDLSFLLCASVPLSAEKGYVRYLEHGPAGLVRIYPQEMEPHARHFRFSSTAYSGGGEARIRFSDGGAEHIVFDRTIRTGFTIDGGNDPKFDAGVVTVKQDGSQIAMQCDNPASIRAIAYDSLVRETFDATLLVDEGD